MASASRCPPPPPQCGRRLLPHVIDDRARNNHLRPFASIPRSTKIEEDGYRDISYRLFANAINRLAQWIIAEVGPPSVDCEPIVYIATLDLRYQILIIAMVKAGYVPFLPSPRNSREAFSTLLKECGATKLITSDPAYPAIPLIRKCQEMQLWTLPSLDELLDETPVSHVDVYATWEQWRARPFVQIHSSGSTGLPKLVTLKHGSFTALDAFQYLEDNELAQRFGNLRCFVTLPGFHIAGITYTLASPVWVDSTVVLPTTAPLTAEQANAAHEHGRVEFTSLPPSVVMDLSKTPKHFHNMTQLKGVMFTGGPLPDDVGRQIAEHTRLFAGYGASEWNAVPQLTKDREDWAYIRFNEREGALEFREQDNGLYELVITQSEEFEIAQPVFATFPEMKEFATKDLFSKHPTKSGLWKYASRLDDIIVFSNGEKLNPVTFEGIVTTSPDVKGCVVVGQGRFQAALLVEPTDEGLNKDELLDKVWPYIQRANEPTVRHGRIARDHVFFTVQGKPLPRAGKGTVQRASTNALYSNEIDELFNKLSTATATESAQSSLKIDMTSVEATSRSLARFLSDELGFRGAHDSDDFFALGMDSLQVFNIVRAINAARPDEPIDTKHIYDNPSILQLAHSLHSEPPARYVDGNDSDDEDLKDSWLMMEAMFRELSSRMTSSGKKNHRRRNLNGWLRSENEGPVIPPDGGSMAWIQVLAMFLVNINNWGLINSFGVFQAFYESDLLSSHSASSIAFIGTLQGALLLIVGVISGPLFDKGYFKPTLVLASFGLVFSIMMLSLSSKYYQVILTQGVLCGVCSGLLYIPSIALVPVYFKRRRGLALGLATGGGSVGGVFYPIIFRRLLVELGFPWAVRVMGFIALLTLGVAAFLSKPIGTRIRRQLLDISAFQEKAYVFFLFSAFFLLMATFVPFFLATSYSIHQLHSTASISFYLISIINAAQFFGRLLPAWSSDYNHRFLGPEAYQIIGQLSMALLGFCWISVRNVGGFIPWLVFYGFFSGTVVTLPAVLLPYICPNLALYGTRVGMLYAWSGVGLLISSPIASAANASTGSFLGSQVWTGTCCLCAALLFLVTGLEIRERRLLYERGKRKVRPRHVPHN